MTGRAILPTLPLDDPEADHIIECPECYGEGDDAQGNECELCMGLGSLDTSEDEIEVLQ